MQRGGFAASRFATGPHKGATCTLPSATSPLRSGLLPRLSRGMITGMRGRSVAALAIALALGRGDSGSCDVQVSSGHSAAASCSEPLSTLSLARGVKDPVFAILLDLVDRNTLGCLSGEGLARELRERRYKTCLPYDAVQEVRRVPASDALSASVTIVFSSPLDRPIPYRIIFYRPGQLRATARLELDEWNLGSVFPLAAAEDAGTDVHLFSLRAGHFEVDLDAWLDLLAGPRLDDTVMTGVALFRWRGQRFGAGLGHNRAAQPRVGLFDFGADKVVPSIPPTMRPLLRRLRDELTLHATSGAPSAD
jgi:hypothetical protein